MTYVWDTNIFIKAVRNPKFLTDLNDQYSFFNQTNEVFVSAVTVGELHSFALKNRWGSKRLADMTNLLEKTTSIPVTNKPELINMYADIDVYSQSQHPTLKLPTSARKMGKNDLWIATTTALTNGILLTTDGDFDHLEGVFLSRIKIPD